MAEADKPLMFRRFTAHVEMPEGEHDQLIEEVKERCGFSTTEKALAQIFAWGLEAAMLEVREGESANLADLH